MIRTVLPGVARGRAPAPASKSYTHRALVAAYVSGRPVRIVHPLDSEDTRATAEGLGRLGATVDRSQGHWTVRRAAGRSRRSITIDCRESGTSLRFLTALAALRSCPVRFTGRGRLPQRPMEALLEPLRSLGATVRYERRGSGLPFTIQGPIAAGEVRVSAAESSQPVSALLLASAALEGPTRIRLQGSAVSRPYVDATLAWLRMVGGEVARAGPSWVVRGPLQGGPPEVTVPGDASSAAYLWAAGAATGGAIEVDGIDRRWPQADLRILEVLRVMGATVRSHGDRIAVAGPLRRGLSVDLTDAPDLYPLVGVLASLVPRAASRLRGAPHLEQKESNRREGTLRLAQSMGARARVQGTAVHITGTGRPRSLRLERLTDHRLVMSAAVAALAGPTPSRIGDSRAVRKSFPAFWSTLTRVVSPRVRA